MTIIGLIYLFRFIITRGLLLLKKLTKKLIDFIQKRMDKLDLFFDKIIKSNVYLKVENTSQKENKIFEVQLCIPGDVIVVKKVSKTFEEGLDAAVHSLERQLKKRKEKLRQFS